MRYFVILLATLLLVPAIPAHAQEADEGKSAASSPSVAQAGVKKAAEIAGTVEKPSATTSDESQAGESQQTEASEADPMAPPTEDANYALLGEYVGEIQVGDEAPRSLGLQIRPIGGDRFEALQYAGGVPGQVAGDAEVLQLIGHRAGDLLILSGGPWALFVEADHCVIIDKDANRLGRLERIERTSPTMGAKPPAGATVLFDGTNTDMFTTAEMTKNGLLKQGADVKPMFQDFNLHVEFQLPYMPEQDDQARGNSGCYLQSRYEVQVLDSFAQLPLFNGCSSIYRVKQPDVNMCLPPLRWQTYDIVFTAPRWGADGSKIRNAHITVWHNGVKTHDDFPLESKTGNGKPEEPTLLPIRFQNHKDEVRFRNIWIIDRGLTQVAEFPVAGAE